MRRSAVGMHTEASNWLTCRQEPDSPDVLHLRAERLAQVLPCVLQPDLNALPRFAVEALQTGCWISELTSCSASHPGVCCLCKS